MNDMTLSPGQGTVTVSDDSTDESENPLMRLVDAAATLLDTKRDEEETNTARSESPFASNLTQSPAPCAQREEKPPTPKVVEVVVNDVSAARDDQKVVRGTKEDLYSVADKKKTFAELLMDILDDETNHDVLAWMPEGDSFTIVNHRKFTMDRMPKLFNIRNMSSFVRKLTRWGFHRVHEKETRNSDIFKHEFFQRDRKDLVRKIRCVKGASSPRPPNSVIPAVIPPREGPVRFVSLVGDEDYHRRHPNHQRHQQLQQTAFRQPSFVRDNRPVNISDHDGESAFRSYASPRSSSQRPAFMMDPLQRSPSSMHSHSSRSSPNLAHFSNHPSHHHQHHSQSLYPPRMDRRVSGDADSLYLGKFTSQVISAALETLQRDEPAYALPPRHSSSAPSSNAACSPALSGSSNSRDILVRAMMQHQTNTPAYDSMLAQSHHRRQQSLSISNHSGCSMHSNSSGDGWNRSTRPDNNTLAASPPWRSSSQRGLARYPSFHG